MYCCNKVLDFHWTIINAKSSNACNCRDGAEQRDSNLFCCRFVKDFSAADVILSFPLEGTKIKLGFEKYPHLQKWLDTIHARPAYKKAEERAGKLEMVE